MNLFSRLRLFLNGMAASLVFAGCMVPARLAEVTPLPTAPFETAVVLSSNTPRATLAPEPTSTETTEPVKTSTATLLPLVLSPTPPQLRFAVIGDYGTGGAAEADVAALVKTWHPDFIITTGDNNYPDGAAATIDDNIGQFYHEFIYPYLGQYGEASETNRFLPSLGNHDWNTLSAQPYLDYFGLPGNERYYDFVWGPIHFFALDSDSREPDGVGSSSAQAAWLQAELAASAEPFNVVYMHHAPYSSAYHGSIKWMQWPFAEWGADLVLAGHDHTYERIERDGIFYVVNGLGGASIYPFGFPVAGSLVRYNEENGAMLAEVHETTVHIEFINSSGDLIDHFEAPIEEVN